jgi:hypothetical protein
VAASGREAGSAWDFETSVSLPPWHLVGVLAPLVFGGPRGPAEYWPSAPIDWHERLFYLGLVPLLAAFLAGGRWRWACWGVAVVAIGLAFGRYAPWYALAQAVLPGYDSMRVPPKHLTLAALALALAAGLGLERLHGRRLAGGLVGLAGLLGLAGLTFEGWFPAWAAALGGSDAFVSAQLPAGAAAQGGAALRVAALLVGLAGLAALLPQPWAARSQLLLAVLDLVLVLQPFRAEVWDPAPWIARYRPLAEFERVAVVGRETIMAAQLAPLVRVIHPSGYSSLVSREYGVLVTGNVARISVRPSRADDPILALLGVQAVFDFGVPSVSVIANPKPAAWVARCARSGGAREVRAADFPWHSCVTLAEPDGTDTLLPPGTAEVLERRAGWLLARADGPGWLVTLEHAYPGWSAWIDGAPVPVSAVDGALVGVRLRDGPQTVALRYRPERFELGLLVSCAAGLTLIGAWALDRPARRARAPRSRSPGG